MTALVFTTKAVSAVSPFHVGNVQLIRPGKGPKDHICSCVLYHVALRNFDLDLLQYKLAKPVLYVTIT